MSDDNAKPERPILRMPLKNFKVLGDLTAEESEWWHSFGRHLEAAQRNFNTVPSRRQK